LRKYRNFKNLISEELELAGLEKGTEVFESKLSALMSLVNEEVKKADRKDAGNDVFEDVEAGDLFIADADSNIGDYEVAADEIIEIVDNGEECVVNIYDADGELREEEVVVSNEDLFEFLDGDVSEVELEDVEEASQYKVKGGKKIKLNKAQIKLKKLKAAGKAVTIDRETGKVRKKTAAEKKLAKKQAKQAKKNFKRGKAKRIKSLAKSRKLNKKQRKANEGFDISANGTIFHVEDGDILTYVDGFLTVERDGVEVFTNLPVSESFLTKCLIEGVVDFCDLNEDVEDDEFIEDEEEMEDIDEECEDKEDDDVEEDCDDEEDEEELIEAKKKRRGVKESRKVKESEECEDEEDDDDVEEDCDDEDKEDEEEEVKESVLVFRDENGYSLVKEGKEIPMGNRIRTRAFLRNMGKTVTSEDLDRAVAGRLVLV
jgi:hypothetical protein